MFLKAKQLLKAYGIKKEDIAPFLLLIIISSTVFLIARFFNLDLANIAPKIFILVFSILCLVTWFMAGFAVFRSLFIVSAGLSLMIFIAQSYCDLPNASRTADDALKSLFGLGLIYIAALFIKSLYQALKGDKDSKGSLKVLEEIYNGKKPWIIIVLYAVFIGLFVWQLYQVLNPIIINLCIYK